MRLRATGIFALGMVVAGGMATWAQTAAVQAQAAQAPAVQGSTAGQAGSGGKLQGVAMSGKIPLPGVTVTAQNTLTGKRYSTTTDLSGRWALTIPQNGRYVVRTQFAAFATGSEEALLNAANREQTVNFDLMLASRALIQQQQQAREGAASEAGLNAVAAQAIQQLAGNGAQSLSLVSALATDTETQVGAPTASGAALPPVAANSDFSSDSVAISGQTGQVSPLAGLDMDRIRDALETARAQGLIPDGQGGGLFGSGGGFGGGGGFAGGGFGGGGSGGGRGGRGNFRGFNPGQPHGAIFWTGSNSALNAEPFSLRGQSQQQPPSGTNRFGLTFMSAPYIPGLTKPSGKDTVFLTLSGQRSSNPSDQYATVPTDAERAGDFSAAGLPAIYDPATLAQFVSNGNPNIANGTPNVIPSSRIAPQAAALLKYFPEPNLPGDVQNYHLLTTAQSNSTQAGVRYMRSLGKNATLLGGGRGGGGGGRRNQNQGLRQSINFNYNWSHSASDLINLFPQLGGKTASGSNAVQAGYTLGYHKVTNIFNANWNRSSAQTRNFFTNGTDIATKIGILGPNGAALNASPLNYGLPNVTLSNMSGLNQQQSSFSLQQTIALSETLSWIHGKHNLRFGGDYRRVHRDLLAGSNATGDFTFSGLFSEDANGDQATGSSLADLLLGLPQETTIDAAVTKSYLRDNVVDAYAQDDWRALPSLTLTYGLRYEFFAPYTEKYGHLAVVDTNPGEGFSGQAEVEAGGAGPFSGRLPQSLVFPFRVGFAPRVGVALRLPKQTVVRAGFGMNYTVGQYATFATTMVHEPPFANQQTNLEADANGKPTSACARNAPVNCTTLADGFPSPPSSSTPGNYALDPHYRLPYVEVWNIDVQKTLPWGVVLSAGYNGSKGNRLDITSAPRASASSPGTDPTNLVFNYEQAAAFSKFSAGTLRVNKRMTGGVSLGANYQYAHSIDDAGSVGGTSTVVAQNWQDPGAEEGNSSFDQRHTVSGTYLYELPFGKDKHWVTSGVSSHILEGFSVSGSFTFVTGMPLTPSYQAAVADVARGTAGTLRPNRVPGVPITAGGGTLLRWFNTGAFVAPAGPFGTASRNSIEAPGKVLNNMSLSKTIQMGDTRSMEIRATLNNAFNTVQYAGVDTSVTSPTFGQVISVGAMRSFNFTARFRF